MEHVKRRAEHPREGPAVRQRAIRPPRYFPTLKLNVTVSTNDVGMPFRISGE